MKTKIFILLLSCFIISCAGEIKPKKIKSINNDSTPAVVIDYTDDCVLNCYDMPDEFSSSSSGNVISNDDLEKDTATTDDKDSSTATIEYPMEYVGCRYESSVSVANCVDFPISDWNGNVEILSACQKMPLAKVSTAKISTKLSCLDELGLTDKVTRCISKTDGKVWYGYNVPSAICVGLLDGTFEKGPFEVSSRSSSVPGTSTPQDPTAASSVSSYYSSSSSEGSSSSVDSFEELGPYETETTSISILNPLSSEIKASIYAPKNLGTSKRSLIIILPGFGAGYWMYYYYSKFFASHGFVVVGMDFPDSTFLDVPDHERNAKEVSVVIDHMLSCNIKDNIDKYKIAVVGHSKGGKIAFYASTMDSRIKIVMAMDPQNTGGAPCFTGMGQCHLFPVAPNPHNEDIGIMDKVTAKSLIFIAPPDPFITPEEQFNAHYFYDGLSKDAMGVYMNTNHIAWLIFNNIIKITKRTMLAYLNVHFYESTMAEKYLNDDMLLSDDIVIKVERK